MGGERRNRLRILTLELQPRGRHTKDLGCELWLAADRIASARVDYLGKSFWRDIVTA
ncbi:MAG: hypothetical protein HOV81_16315 [Kofleriaceae bacterium]|nr:hypothetical protein [Kofleriaceae bacterium]